MCMENVNISTTFFENDLSEINGPVQFGKRIEKLHSFVDSDNSIKISTLTVATFASAISCSKDPKLENEYDIMWILEPEGAEKNERVTLATSIYDTKKNKTDQNTVKVCRSFSNQTFKFTLRDLQIARECGMYFLKVFLKLRGTEDVWQIQSINAIEVEKTNVCL